MNKVEWLKQELKDIEKQAYNTNSIGAMIALHAAQQAIIKAQDEELTMYNDDEYKEAA